MIAVVFLVVVFALLVVVVVVVLLRFVLQMLAWVLHIFSALPDNGAVSFYALSFGYTARNILCKIKKSLLDTQCRRVFATKFAAFN